MKRLLPISISLLVIAGIFSSTVFIVREIDYALVFALGEVKKIVSEPGLYFKLPPPFQNVVLLDKRLLTIDVQEAERIQTSEKKNLVIDSYVKWRIVDPRLFYITFGGNERAARDRLQALIRDALNASVNVRTVKDVVSLERDVIMNDTVMKSFRIEIVDRAFLLTLVDISNNAEHFLDMLRRLRCEFR